MPDDDKFDLIPMSPEDRRKSIEQAIVGNYTANAADPDAYDKADDERRAKRVYKPMTPVRRASPSILDEVMAKRAKNTHK